MKKFIFGIFACMTLSFMACGNKTAGTGINNDSDSTVVDSLDSASVDSASVK